LLLFKKRQVNIFLRKMMHLQSIIDGQVSFNQISIPQQNDIQYFMNSCKIKDWALDWQSGSSGRVPTKHASGPVLKSQYRPKKKKR
jgi:hypothetical protein